ncbi:MAG: hypothetical protein CMB61_06525 [Euryarchaeota archaeon]|nr:hypothetical protein [Euryarchaeota archaeon]
MRSVSSSDSCSGSSGSCSGSSGSCSGSSGSCSGSSGSCSGSSGSCSGCSISIPFVGPEPTSVQPERGARIINSVISKTFFMHLGGVLYL